MVMNCGIFSYTSDNILMFFDYFFDWVSRRELWKEKESIIVIAIWINDVSVDKITKLPRVDKDQFIRNINAIIQKCNNENLIKKIIFITNINIDEEIVNNDIEWNFLFYNSEIEKYNNILKSIWLLNSIDCIDLFWKITFDDLEDWLHPNSKWHLKIFNIVCDYFENNIINNN